MRLPTRLADTSRPHRLVLADAVNRCPRCPAEPVFCLQHLTAGDISQPAAASAASQEAERGHTFMHGAAAPSVSDQYEQLRCTEIYDLTLATLFSVLPAVELATIRDWGQGVSVKHPAVSLLFTPPRLSHLSTWDYQPLVKTSALFMAPVDIRDGSLYLKPSACCGQMHECIYCCHIVFR